MQNARFSTIRFNEWICVSAQYEKAVVRLGRQVYQAYSKEMLSDYTTLELCKEVSDTFADARLLRSEMEEEFERDALDGLNVEEAKKADEVRQLTQAQHTKRKAKLKITKFMGRQAINKRVTTHRDRVRELSRDIGLRALVCFENEPILTVPGHKNLCRLALRLRDDSDNKWQEITESNKSGGGLSFHIILMNFVANFANFSKGTYVGKFLLKFFKYNEKEEEEKLTKQYEGSNTAKALRAQLDEIDEPHLDVGREMDNMQQEYEETPEEWGLPEENNEDYETDDFKIDSEPAEKWEPEIDTWNPDVGEDEDFLGAVAAAPDLPAEEFEPDPAPNRPTLLRKRSEPDSGVWQEEEGMDSTPAIQPNLPTLPKVGMSVSPSLKDSPVLDAPKSQEDVFAPIEPAPQLEITPRVEAAPQVEPTPPVTPKGEDDWGWGNSATDEAQDSWQPDPKDSFQETSQIVGSSSAPQAPDTTPSSLPMETVTGPQAEDPFSFPTENDPFAAPASGEDPFAAPTSGQDPFASQAPKDDPFASSFPARAQTAEEKPTEVRSKPTGKRPPFVTSQDSQSQPLGWGTPTQDEEYGWGVPAAQTESTPAAPANSGPAPEEVPGKPTPQIPTQSTPPPSIPNPGAPTSSTPREMKDFRNIENTTPTPEKTNEAEIETQDVDLDDDLLPAFLKNRKESEASQEEKAFIPELPSFLQEESDLEILPFGSKNENKDKKPGPG